MLIRVRNPIYFSNVDADRFVAKSCKTCLLGLESDCGVYFVTSDVKKSNARNKKKYSTKRTGRPTEIEKGKNGGSYYRKRVQRIRKRIGTKWGISHQSIDLLNRPNVVAKKASEGLVIWSYLIGMVNLVVLASLNMIQQIQIGSMSMQ